MITPMVTMTATTSWVAKGSIDPEENVEEGADGEGDDAPAADAEGELAGFRGRRSVGGWRWVTR